MQARLQEIRERLEGYSIVLKKDMIFLLDALEQAQEENKKISKLYSEMFNKSCDVLADLIKSQDRERVLREALQEFCDRVERGEVRSRRTYSKFKQLLQEDKPCS